MYRHSLALLVALALPAAAHAQQTPAPAPITTPAATTPPATGAPAPQPVASPPADPDAPPIVPARESQVNLAIIPYIWLPGSSGTITANGLTQQVNDTFFDVLNGSSKVFGLMGALELEYERFVFEIDGTYSHAEFDDTKGVARSGPGGGGLSVNVKSQLSIDEAWYQTYFGYRVVELPFGEDQQTKQLKSMLTLDAFAGLRYTTLSMTQVAKAKATITLPNGRVLTAGTKRTLDGSQEWFEPFIGAQMDLVLDEHWMFMLRSDVGGFGVDGSHFAWQAVGAFGYRWNLDNWSIALFGGYRALGQDYENGGFTWDVITHGPILGLSFEFAF